MNLLANWITPETVKLVAFALLHFLWQGAALAALGYVALSVCRSASTRYVVGVATLALMFVAPVITLISLRAQQSAAVSAGEGNSFRSSSRLACTLRGCPRA